MSQAWLTPDVDQFSESQTERSIVLPGSLWLYISGALELLANGENWEEFGTATVEEAVSFFSDIVDQYAMSDFRNVGMISPFASATVPFGWIVLQGQAVLQSDYPELVSRVPSTWLSGSNINLPDLRGGGAVVGGGTHPVHGNIVNGSVGGSPTHTLSQGELPAHQHAIQVVAGTTTATPGASTAILQAQIGGNTSLTGGGNPHNNMPPYLAARWCIYAGR